MAAREDIRFIKMIEEKIWKNARLLYNHNMALLRLTDEQPFSLSEILGEAYAPPI